MIAFFGNLGPTEFVLLLVVAILVFGKRLPQVAGQAYVQLKKLRTSMDSLRRETGIDHEIRAIERTMRETARQASLEEALEVSPRARKEPPRGHPVEAAMGGATVEEEAPSESPDAGSGGASDLEDRREEKPEPPV